MSRRAVTGVVAVVVAVIAAVSAPAAVAKPVLPPLPIPPHYVGAPAIVVDRADGTLTFQGDVLTTGLQALVDARQRGSWGGQGVLASAAGPALMVCIGSGYSNGSIISEYSNTAIELTCTTSTPKPRLTCQLWFTRLGAAVEIHGTCSLVTVAETYPLTAEGSLTWVPTQTGAPVTTALLTGTIALVDPNP